jgi:NAD(P)-dependent dehydrogenase (short-subunit alcohol dehydrogenase family)
MPMIATAAGALQLFDLTGRTAIVMGVGALGRSLSEALASAGAKLLLVDGDASALDAHAHSLHRRFEIKVECLVSRPSDERSASEMVERAMQSLGGVNILVVTAGGNIVAPAVEMSMDEWDEIMRVNVRASWLAARAAARVMIKGENGGKIVLTSSVRGRLGLSNYSAYVPAKHAIDGLVRSLACEWAPHRINVNAIAPVVFRSNLTAWMFSDDAAGANVRASMLSRIPLGRLAEPEDFAGTALYLCSAASDFCTGQILYVDGGYTAC